MAVRTKKTKEKKEGKILNDQRENPVDFVAVKDETGEEYQAKTLNVESKTHLDDDKGYGDAITLRAFTFGANLQAFLQHKPNAQELFNSHIKQIEIELWKDGWAVYPEVLPRIVFSTNGKDFEPFSPAGKQYTHYRIFIPAKPAKGNLLSGKPQTLSEIAYGRIKDNK